MSKKTKVLNNLPPSPQISNVSSLPSSPQISNVSSSPPSPQTISSSVKKCIKFQITNDQEFNDKFNKFNKYIQLQILQQYLNNKLQKLTTNEYLTQGTNNYDVNIPYSIDTYIRIDNNIICIIYDWNKDNNNLQSKIDEYNNFKNKIYKSKVFQELPNKKEFEISCVLISNNHYDNVIVKMLNLDKINILEYNINKLEDFLSNIILYFNITDINKYIKNIKWHDIYKIKFDKNLLSKNISLILKDINNDILFDNDVIISHSKYTNDVIIVYNNWKNTGSCGNDCVNTIISLCSNFFAIEYLQSNLKWFVLTKTEMKDNNKKKLINFSNENNNFQFVNIFNSIYFDIIDLFLSNDIVSNMIIQDNEYKLQQRMSFELQQGDLQLEEHYNQQVQKIVTEGQLMEQKIETQELEQFNSYLSNIPNEMKQEKIQETIVKIEMKKQEVKEETHLKVQVKNQQLDISKEQLENEMTEQFYDKKELLQEMTPQQNGFNFEEKLENKLNEFFDWGQNLRENNMKKFFSDIVDLNTIDHILIYNEYMILIQDKIHKKTIGQQTVSAFIKATERIFKKYKNYKFLCIYVSLNGLTKGSHTILNEANEENKQYQVYYEVNDISEDLLIEKTIDLIKRFPRTLKRDNPFDSDILYKLSDKLTGNFEISDIISNILTIKKKSYYICVKNEWNKKGVNLKQIDQFIKYSEDEIIEHGNENIYLFILITKNPIDSNIIEQKNKNYLFKRFFHIINDEQNRIIDMISDKINEYPRECRDLISRLTDL